MSSVSETAPNSFVSPHPAFSVILLIVSLSYSLNTCRLYRHRYLPHRLVWHPPQQSRFPCCLQRYALGHIRFARRARIHDLPPPHLQSRRQDQCRMVTLARNRWPSPYPKRPRLLRLLFTILRGNRQSDLLLTLHTPWLQGPVFEV